MSNSFSFTVFHSNWQYFTHSNSQQFTVIHCDEPNTGFEPRLISAYFFARWSGWRLLLCGGKLEDSDYSEYYNGHDTTLEGLEKLAQRLESHDADVTYQLYDTHHYQYIPEMLTAYLKQTYPAN